MTPENDEYNAVEAAIFDLDGVIFDSAEANVAFYNHLLEVLGLPPMAEASRAVVHSACLDDSLMHLTGDPALVQKAKDYFRSLDPAPFLAMLRPFPHAVSTIRCLAGRLRLAVATNRMDTTRRALAHVGLSDAFEAVITPAEAQATKPDPRMMETALERLGLRRRQVVYIGDSEVDDHLCRAAGVRLVAFRNPGLRAWAHVEDFRDLPGLLGL